MSVPVRSALRKLVVNALNASTGPGSTGVTVVSPGDWNVPGSLLPVIKVRSGQETKTSLARAQPDFTTDSAVELQLAVQAASAEAAQDAMETLLGQVEDAIFCNAALVSAVQQFTRVTSIPTFTAEGDQHIAGLAMTIDMEVVETFDPFAVLNAVPLQQVNVTVDSANVFDASGTYANPAFPSSVLPAPRTQGPDGRAEGGLVINLPT